LASCAQAGQVAPINPTDAACPRKRLREERLTDIERDSQPLADIRWTVADRLLPGNRRIPANRHCPTRRKFVTATQKLGYSSNDKVNTGGIMCVPRCGYVMAEFGC
jgi:hypothetical protein